MNYTQELKISVPDGKKAIYDEVTQTIKFVDTEPIRSKSCEEFCQNHPKILDDERYIIAQGIVKTGYAQSFRTKEDRGYLDNEEDAEGILALIQLKRLHDEWVGKYDPQCYAIVNDKDGIRIYHIGDKEYRFLWFHTYEMAFEFAKCFNDLIVAAKMFL